MNIGIAVQYYRKLYNLTQSEVAELSGINEKYLGRIERAESVPTIDKVQQLCMAFDIRVGDLLMSYPEKALLDLKSHDPSNLLIPDGKIVEGYYCNCCGCTFQTRQDENEDIVCPECGCLYNEEDEFIEKNIIVVD